MKRKIFWIVLLLVSTLIALVVSFRYSHQKFFGNSNVSAKPPIDYKNLFSDNSSPSLISGLVYNNSNGFPIATFLYSFNLNYSITVFKTNIDTVSTLEKILEFSAQTNLPQINEDNYQNVIENFEAKYIPNFPQAKRINLRINGDSIKKIKFLDTLVAVATTFKSIGVFFNGGSLPTIFFKADGKGYGGNMNEVMSNIAFLKKSGYLYIIFLTTNNNHQDLPPNFLVSLLR